MHPLCTLSEIENESLTLTDWSIRQHRSYVYPTTHNFLKLMQSINNKVNSHHYVFSLYSRVAHNKSIMFFCRSERK